MAFICPQENTEVSAKLTQVSGSILQTPVLGYVASPPDQNSGYILREKHLGIPVPWGGTRKSSQGQVDPSGLLLSESCL